MYKQEDIQKSSDQLQTCYILPLNIATIIPVRDDKSCLNCLLNCLLLILEDKVESELAEKFEL